MSQTLQFTASIGLGLFLGLLNWAFWTRWTKNLLQRSKSKLGFLVAVSLLKLTLIGLIIWWVLKYRYADPFGFLIGFSIVVLGLILKGFKWQS